MAQSLFFILCVASLIVAVYAAFKDRLTALFLIGGVALAALAVTLFTLDILINDGAYPGATGMEGLAFFIMPGIFLATGVASFLIYGVVSYFAGRS